MKMEFMEPAFALKRGILAVVYWSKYCWELASTWALPFEPIRMGET